MCRAWVQRCTVGHALCWLGPGVLAFTAGHADCLAFSAALALSAGAVIAQNAGIFALLGVVICWVALFAPGESEPTHVQQPAPQNRRMFCCALRISQLGAAVPSSGGELYTSFKWFLIRLWGWLAFLCCRNHPHLWHPALVGHVPAVAGLPQVRRLLAGALRCQRRMLRGVAQCKPSTLLVPPHCSAQAPTALLTSATLLLLARRALPGLNSTAVGLIVTSVFQLTLSAYKSSPFPNTSICIGAWGPAVLRCALSLCSVAGR